MLNCRGGEIHHCVTDRLRQSETAQQRDSQRSSSLLATIYFKELLGCESTAFVLLLGKFALIIHVPLLCLLN